MSQEKSTVNVVSLDSSKEPLGPHGLLGGLLRYIEGMEKLGRKAAYGIDPQSLLGFQDDIEGLPGVVLGSGKEGESWLEVQRLAKNPVPPLPAGLVGKIEIEDSPSVRPSLMEEFSKDGQAQSELAAYLVQNWEPWAEEEPRRRAGIRLYQRLFALHQTMAMDTADSPMEILWGIGVSSWRVDGKKQRVHHPLITQACVVELGRDDFAIRVNPAPAMARLEIECYADMEVPGVKRLEAQWRDFSEAMGDGISPFVEETYAPMLSMAAQVLCDSGRCELDASCAPEPGPSLVVTGSWSLHARRKASHFLVRDVERLREAALAMGERGAALPGFAQAFVERGSDHSAPKARRSYRGMSSGSELDGAEDLCFPLPYNQEQVRIIQELDRSSGVVVQGPPGTGKTHTIANIVAHYLAQGKKVLVTAKGETALSVVKGKLPEGIARLCVALLSDEADGMRQFELSVSAIAGEVAQVDEAEQEAKASEISERIGAVHAAIAMLDRQAADSATLRMGEHGFQGELASAGEVARALQMQAGELGWLAHESVALGSGALMPEIVQVEAAREARRELGADVVFASGAIGEVGDIASTEEAMHWRKATLRQVELSKLRESGDLRPLRSLGRKAIQEASQRLGQELSTAVSEGERIRGDDSAPSWVEIFASALGEELVQGKRGPAMALSDLASKAEIFEVQRKALVADAVEISEGSESSGAFLDELGRLARGAGGGVMGLWRNKEGKRLCALATLGGSVPTSPALWAKVEQWAKLRLAAKAMLASWRACAAEFGWDIKDQATSGDVMVLWRSARSDFERVRGASRFAHALGSARRAASELFERPFEIDGGAQQARAIDSQVVLGIESLGLSEIIADWENRRLAWASWNGPLAKAMEEVEAELTDPGADEALLARRWSALVASARHLATNRETVMRLAKACKAISEAGAPQWASDLLRMPGEKNSRAIDGPEWIGAWEWRAWHNQLSEAMKSGDAMSALSRRRAREDELAKLYEELAVAKAWLGVKRACSPSVAQRLRQYLAAVRSMGKGTGVRAERHRKTAREAMGEAYKAIPCWIMPHWRVSESMLSEIGVFDLVIVDEASQSDIWALPALLRGSKILVVGDHKQVSPSAVGVAEEDIRELSARFLAGQPHGSEMSPDKSIYDLASVVFADSAVMLREHFRCDPAIIEFSNKNFYGGQIRPLRSPTRSSEIGAPLVDVFVRDGFRVGDKNPPEARAIVDMAKRLLADPAFAGKSMGVVTLLGSEQATLISKMVADEIAPFDIVERGLAVGSPVMFQGRERDVMLVSMVLASGNRSWADKLDMEQRLNVAMSRGRDKVFLFRSVESSEVGAKTLAGKLLAHFEAPFGSDAARVQAARELCESDFEREMFDEMRAMGFTPKPQFPCGGFRIDFVVEGADGRRLAIECDGDRFHGPGRWSDDMARQRVLERAGWSFWRCFASDFALDKGACMESLSKALMDRGIDPGSAPRAGHALVERQSVVALAGSVTPIDNVGSTGVTGEPS